MIRWDILPLKNAVTVLRQDRVCSHMFARCAVRALDIRCSSPLKDFNEALDFYNGWCLYSIMRFKVQVAQ